MIEKVKAFALALAGIGVLLLGLSAYLDRYEIVPRGDGVVRLDKRTGEVCRVYTRFGGEIEFEGCSTDE